MIDIKKSLLEKRIREVLALGYTKEEIKEIFLELDPRVQDLWRDVYNKIIKEKEKKKIEPKKEEKKTQLKKTFAPISTRLDPVLELVNEAGIITLNDLAMKFGLTYTEMEEWCKALEKNGLLNVIYPVFKQALIMDPVLNAINKKKNITLNELALKFKLSYSEIENKCKKYKEKKMIEIAYPLTGPAYAMKKKKKWFKKDE